jgi:adenylate kinase
MDVVVFGPPGSGKGTQAKKLKGAFNFTHLSTGDLLRDAIKNQTDLGLKVRTIIDSGRLVSDDVVNALVEEFLNKDSARSVIYDGYPRTVEQAHFLTKVLALSGRKIDSVVFLEVNSEVVVNRAVGRRVCSNCGTIFHIVNSPPKTEGVCDNCKGKLVHRGDDKPETIAERLKEYRDSTQMVRDFYKENNRFVTIDGTGSQDVVHEKICEFLKLNKN